MKEYDFFSDTTLLIDDISINKYTKTSNFQIHSTKFLTELLLQDGYLLLPKFIVYKEFVSNLFEFNIGENIELREFLLKSLLDFSKEEQIVNKIVDCAKSEQITADTLDLLVQYSLKALDSCLFISQEYITAIDSLIISFGLSRSKYSQQLDRIDSSKEKKVVHSSFDLLKNLSDSPLFLAANQPVTVKPDSDSRAIGPFKLGSLMSIVPGAAKQKQTPPFSFKTTKSVENEKTRALVSGINELNRILKSDLITREVQDLARQLLDDNRRIVIAGEIKHGKSSLFNKILGEYVSPEGESTATTAAVAELFYSEKPVYEIQWISNDTINRTVDYIKENENNPHVAKYKYYFEELIANTECFEAGEVFKGERSKNELHKYLCAGGEYVPGVEKVRIGNPIECLKDGAILVDTPGLNDPMEIRNNITLDQANLADTLIFVMRADKFGTGSERSFLEKIAKNGKIQDLVVVITHIDLVKKDQLNNMEQAVKEWLRQVPSKDSRQTMKNMMYEASVFMLDTKNNFEAKAAKAAYSDEFDRFIRKISDTGDRGNAAEKYIAWIKEKRAALTGIVNSEMNKFLQLDEKSNINRLLMEKLSDVITQLENLSAAYEEQVSARLSMIEQKHYDDYTALKEMSEKCLEATKSDFLSAIKNKVEELGLKYSSTSKWRSFDDDVAKGIVSKNTLELERQTKRILSGWPEIIDEFKKDLDSDFNNTFSYFPKIRDQYADIAKMPAYIFSLCKASDAFDALEKNMRKIAYIAAGTALVVGALVFTGGVTLPAVTISLSSSSMAMAAGGAGTLLAVKATGVLDKDRAKDIFIEHKVKNVNKEVERHFECFDRVVYDEFKKIEEVLIESSVKAYSPIISSSLASSRDLKYQIELAAKMQADMRRYADSILALSPDN